MREYRRRDDESRERPRANSSAFPNNFARRPDRGKGRGRKRQQQQQQQQQQLAAERKKDPGNKNPA